MSYCDDDSYNKKAIKLEKFTLLRMRRDANKTLKCYQVSEKIHGSDSVLDWSLYLNLRLRNFKRKKTFHRRNNHSPKSDSEKNFQQKYDARFRRSVSP